MSFNWTPENKEKYYQEADKIIKDIGFYGLLQIDYTKFAVMAYNNQYGIFDKSAVCISLLPIKQDKTQVWEAAKAADPRIKDDPEINDSRMYRIKRPSNMIFGCIEINMED